MKKLIGKIKDVFIVENGVLKPKDFICYGLGGLGQNIIYYLMSGYLLIFYTDVLKIPTAAVGTMFLIAKIWDAINDPIMGALADKNRSKWGKMRPFLFVSPIPIAIITIMLFYCPDLSVGGKTVYMYCTYILWGMIYTVGDIPYWSMSALMSPHPQERTNLITITNYFISIGSALPSIIFSAFFALRDHYKATGVQSALIGTDRELYFCAALVMSVVGGGLFLLAGIGTREVVPQKKEAPKFSESIKYLVKNKYLMLILLCNLLAFPKSISGLMQIYVAKYIFGSESWAFILGVPAAVGGILSMALAPFFMKKFGAIKTYLIANIYSLIPMGLLYFIGLPFIANGLGTVQQAVILVFLFLNSLSTGIIGIIPPILIADSIDWMEYKTYQRNEGVAFSIKTFMAKATSALQTKATTIALGMIHYIQPPAGTDFVVQSAETIKGLWAWYTIIPVALSLLSIIPLLFYDLKGEKLDEVHDELERRHTEENAVALAEE